MSDNCSIVLVNKVKFIWHYKECLNHSQPKKSHKCDTWLDLLPPPRRLSFQPCPFVGWFVSWITQKPQNGLLQNLDWGNVSAQIGSQELFVWTLIKAWIQEFFLTFLVCARHFSNFWLISLGAMHRSWRKNYQTILSMLLLLLNHHHADGNLSTWLALFTLCLFAFGDLFYQSQNLHWQMTR